MNRLKNILAAVDFSAASRAALLQAARLARANEAVLHLLHVIPRRDYTDLTALVDDEQAEVVRHLVEDAHTRLKAELVELGVTQPAEIHVATGNVIHEILQAVRGHEVDLLTAGVNGASKSAGIGTIAVRCARKAPTKVLLVPAHTTDGFERVVACVDFSELTDGVLQQAIRVAAVDGAMVTALHVYQAPWERVRWGGVPPNAAEMDEQLRTLLLSQLRESTDRHAAEAPGVEVQHDLIECADFGDGIVHCAREAAADLVVLGTTGRGALAYMLLGTTAEKVMRDVGCAVLAVKAPRVSAGDNPEPEAHSA